MTTYCNHTHMTAVPTRLLLDTNLSAEAKLTGALLYTFEDGGLSAQELADVLTLPPEKVAPVFAELTGNGYLEILEEKGTFGAAPEGGDSHAGPHATHPQGNLPERAGSKSHPAQNAPVGDAQLRRVCPENAD